MTQTDRWQLHDAGDKENVAVGDGNPRIQGRKVRHPQGKKKAALAQVSNDSVASNLSH